MLCLLFALGVVLFENKFTVNSNYEETIFSLNNPQNQAKIAAAGSLDLISETEIDYQISPEKIIVKKEKIYIFLKKHQIKCLETLEVSQNYTKLELTLLESKTIKSYTSVFVISRNKNQTDISVSANFKNGNNNTNAITVHTGLAKTKRAILEILKQE